MRRVAAMRGCVTLSVMSAATEPPNGSMQTRQDLKELARVLEVAWDKMTSYTNVVLGLGYGALFAVWTQADSFLSDRWRATAGLLAVISVMLFVTFEVTKVYFVSQAWVHLSKVDGGTGDLRHVAGAIKVDRRCVRLWQVTYIPTVVTGYAAAIIIAAGLASSLFR
jgi:hypothetical protein